MAMVTTIQHRKVSLLNPFSEKPKGFPVEETVLNPQFVDIEEDRRSVRDTLSDPLRKIGERPNKKIWITWELSVGIG